MMKSDTFLLQLFVVFIPVYLILMSRQAVLKGKNSSTPPPSPFPPGKLPEKPLKYQVQPGVETFTHHRKGCERPDGAAASSSRAWIVVAATVIAFVLLADIILYVGFASWRR